MKINRTLGSLSIKYELTDRLYIFSTASGTGKTFFFSLLRSDAKNAGLSCIVFNNRSVDLGEKAIKEAIKGKDLVVFDNADLYLSQDMVDIALSQGSMVLISMKHYEGKINLKGASVLAVKYAGNTLEVQKV